MKLVTFEVQTVLGRFQRLGAFMDDWVLDLNAAYGWLLAEEGEAQPKRLADVVLPANMRQFLEMGERSFKAANQIVRHLNQTGEGASPEALPEGLHGAQLGFSLSEVRLKTPLPEPNMLRDFLAFEVHTKSGYDRRGQPMPEAWYKIPVYYKGNHRALLGPKDYVIWPRYTQKLDYELELACIIGKQGRDIPVEEASQYIFGYAILNDFSARDIQMEEMTCRLGPAKGKDFASAIGPYIVTTDEVGDVRNLNMVARINGEVWSEGNSGTSHWTFEQIIAHVSNEETLYPGDILGSGTVGRGCGLELDRWLQPGDVVELEIEKLGILRNQVVTHEMYEEMFANHSGKSALIEAINL
jgi:2-keto-4-pentenoate hydratase/2-oxohepta-3-ene-1,7-dioic acid hydratase in catechol pathway